MRQALVPLPKEDLRFVWLPRGQDQIVQLVHQGQETENHRYRENGLLEARLEKIQERLPTRCRQASIRLIMIIHNPVH